MTDLSLEYFNRKFDDLEASIQLAFQIAPAHLRNEFTGLNVRRRRSDKMTREFAIWFANSLCRSYLFYNEELPVNETEMADFLHSCFSQVSDIDAKACGAKSTMDSEPARKKLAADLHAAIIKDWRSVYSPRHLRNKRQAEAGDH